MPNARLERTRRSYIDPEWGCDSLALKARMAVCAQVFADRIDAEIAERVFAELTAQRTGDELI